MNAMSLGDFGGGRPLLEGVDQDGILEVAVQDVVRSIGWSFWNCDEEWWKAWSIRLWNLNFIPRHGAFDGKGWVQKNLVLGSNIWEALTVKEAVGGEVERRRLQ